MYVACSSLCFGRYPLADALHTISEFTFHKVDLALHEAGPHLRPSDVLADVNRIAQQLRKSNLAFAAFHVELGTVDAEKFRVTLRAVCRLGRVLAVPLVNIPAAPKGSDVAQEVTRLTSLTRIAQSEGVILLKRTVVDRRRRSHSVVSACDLASRSPLPSGRPQSRLRRVVSVRCHVRPRHRQELAGHGAVWIRPNYQPATAKVTNGLCPWISATIRAQYPMEPDKLKICWSMVCGLKAW